MSRTTQRSARPVVDTRLLRAEIELLGANGVSEGQVLRRALELAVDLTGSRAGHVHYVDADQSGLQLAVATSDDRAWPDPATWTRAVRRQMPQTVMQDDGSYASVPVVGDGRVHLLLGITGDGHAYSPEDLAIVSRLGAVAWAVAMRLREERILRSRLELLTARQAVMGLTTWEWDPEGEEVVWDGAAEQVIPDFPADERSWQPLLRMLDEPSAVTLQAALATREPFSLELSGSNPDGSALKVMVQAGWSGAGGDGGRPLHGTLTDISLVSALEHAHRQATHDILTGLPNRAWLTDALSERILRPRSRRSDAFALYFIDLDDFKSVNDQFGHLVGDEVLVTCAHRIEVQTRERGKVARYGGDEFVLIQDGPLTWETVESLAQRIRQSVAEPLRVEGQVARVGASVGVAVCSSGGTTVSDLLRNADEALFEAKRSTWGVVIRDV